MSNQNHYQQKLARILRVETAVVSNLEKQLERITGKAGVLKNLMENNAAILQKKMSELGLATKAKAQEIYDALVSKVEADDIKLSEAIRTFFPRDHNDQENAVDFVKKVHFPGKGFFLKKEKAKQLLIAQPPKKILASLGYKYVEELLEKEDLLEVYSALRFLEDADWQNSVFFKQYEALRPEDFEEREIEMRVLDGKWARAAEAFVAKKYHNVSHLKELGVVFVVPVFLGISGETLRLVTLLFHYLHEVEYYSSLFFDFSKNEHDFAKKLISTLRGDVIENPLPEFPIEVQRPRFLVIQRYLAKNSINDWRLFQPHINPEALHWERAEAELSKIKEIGPDFQNGLEFWSGIGWTGDYFPSENNSEVLVNFNIIDTIMSLVKQRELVKYLYHHQEALWNKIFIDYFGAKQLEEKSKEYLIRGWFEI